MQDYRCEIPIAICACIPSEICLPEYFVMHFIHKGKKVTLWVFTPCIFVPEQEQTLARATLPRHLFVDAHLHKDTCYVSIELAGVFPLRRDSTPYWFRYYFYKNQTMLTALRWKYWQQLEFPDGNQVVHTAQELLRRHRQRASLESLYTWLEATPYNHSTYAPPVIPMKMGIQNSIASHGFPPARE